MRWEELFQELGHEWEAAEVAAEQAEVAERTRAERARVSLLARMRGSVGRPLRVHTPSGVVEGTLHTVAGDCLLLSEGTTDVLVPVSQVNGLEGLGGDIVPDDRVGLVERRLGLAALLRRLARDRCAVGVQRIGTPPLHGTPVLVGADFVELATHEPGEVARGAAVRGRQVVPLEAIVTVRCRR
jgi:hypothetical protein